MTPQPTKAASRPSSPEDLPIARSIAELRSRIADVRQAGRQIGFVPTMGALHAGHVSLIEAATADGAFTVVSIYVNPTQFGPNEDFSAYPRTLDADRVACHRGGADLIYAPIDQEIYPPGEQTRVRPGKLAASMCGLARPGHFEGVCTVVAKLFNIVQPDAAYFGQKDAQQALIIRRMARDLCFPVRIVVCPIVREPDGLAMSSRNAYLSPKERRQALGLNSALSLGRDRLLAKNGDIAAIIQAMEQEIHRVAQENEGAATIDYVVICDAETLEPLTRSTGKMLLATAVRIGKTRLIDNLIVELPEH